jgi:hypothetical protein
MIRGNGRSIGVSIGQKALTVNAEAARSGPAPAAHGMRLDSSADFG